jgi:DNA polymerase I
MEFQVLDVDYVIVNDKPVLRVFGKDPQGESVCGFYEGFLPYFYAVGDDVEGKLEGNPHVIKTETVKRTLPVGYQQPRDVCKITLRNPAKTIEVREALRAMGVVPYEADIMFKYRWMNDVSLGGMKWISTEDTNGITTDSVSAGKKVKMHDFRTVEKYEDAPLKYMAFDIETVGDDGVMPDEEKDPVVLISVVFSPDYRGKGSLVLSTRADGGVEACADEKAMLERFRDIINEYDADVLTGFNITNYDMPYILKRMEKNNVRPVFGRCKSKQVRDDVFAGRHRINITGRILADSFQLIRKGWNLKRYGLDFVAKELIGEKKRDVKKSEIGKFWRGTQQQFSTLVDYCLHDSVLAMKLLLNMNLLDKYIALSKISGSLVSDILDGGETQRIENYFLREFNKEGYIIPTKVNGERRANGDVDKDLKGGFVIEPKKGLHSMVLVLDFKSMYPSLIRTFNICPTTLLIGDENVDSITTPNGSRFVKKEMKHGIIPRILENLMLERAKVKKQMKDADARVKKALDMKQLAIKVMANAFYGYFGYHRAKIHSIDIASSVTALGRQTIHDTVKTMEEEFGYEVVYGDTDSVMIKVPTESMEEAERIGKKLGEKMTGKLPGVMELEFEKLFKRFLPLTKKRYMGWSMFRDKNGEWKDDIIMKGIETVRRDWCELTGETMREIIEIILKKNDVKEAVNYFKAVVNDLLEGKVDADKLTITKTITKRPEAYVGVQPHVEVIKKMQQRGALEIPGTGDRIGYVIVKGMDMLSKRAEDPSYVKEKGLQLDPRYYIDNQLLPPVERIFTAIGVSKEELLGLGKQMGLTEAINNHRRDPAAPEPLKVAIEDVNGFICRRCHRSFARPPLIGKCECGGSLLFSSERGPADVALTR